MMLRADSGRCDRARAWVSLRLDGEISEFEDAMLQAHIGRCAECSAYERTVGGAVEALRTQPLEQIRHPVVVTRSRRINVNPAAAARVAALVAAVVGVSAVLGTQSAKGPTAVPQAKSPIAATDDNDLETLRQLRVLQLGGTAPRQSGVGSFGAVPSS